VLTDLGRMAVRQLGKSQWRQVDYWRLTSFTPLASAGLQAASQNIHS